MIIHSENGLKYEVQWSIKTIQTTQHVKTSDQLNTTGAELGPAQPQLVWDILANICVQIVDPDFLALSFFSENIISTQVDSLFLTFFHRKCILYSLTDKIVTLLISR